MMMVIELPIDAEKLIPHRKPMRVIDRLLEATDQAGTAEVIIQADHVLVDRDGRLDRTTFLEMIAQTYAAVQGHVCRQTGRAITAGFLVGIRRCEVSGDAVAGDQLIIRAHTVKQFAGFAVVDGSVILKNDTIAEASIKVWIPPAEPQESV
jgi:predicted hotdog family 3-hydroxylacyl-ACP dehydratase